MRKDYPPGPRDWLLGVPLANRFSQEPLAFAMDLARTYGDFAFVRMGWVRVYFVNRPELIREVLSTKAKSFHKLRRQMDALRILEGDSVNTTDGEVWRRKRPVVQPAFHTRHFARFAQVFVEYTRRRLTRWSAGTVFDAVEEMNQLALELIAKVLFDVDWSDRAAQLREAVHVFRDYVMKEASRLVVVPAWLPLPGKLRQRRAVGEIDRLIWELIRQRRAAPAQTGDLLSLMLAAAQEAAAVPPITDQEIRDEAATLFIAGHDTTSASLAWLWYLLAGHPEVEARLLREVDEVLGDRPATYEDLRRLRYTEMVVKESMRLYPASAFLFGREAVEDVELGGYTLRRGSWVLISPYVVHHNPQYFKDPDVFDPERFAPGRVEEIPPYAHLTFGAGPRICIGNNLALTEVVLVAATVLQRFRLQLSPDQGKVEPTIEIVLRPRGSLLMQAVPREKPASGGRQPPVGMPATGG
jgi:cytochrome P450